MSDTKDPVDPTRFLKLVRIVDRTTGATASDLALPAESAITPEDLHTFLDLVGRVDRDRPNERDLVALDRALAAHPGLWRLLADLASRAIDVMIEQLSDSVGLRASLRRGADEMLSALAGSGGSPLESALAEQIAVCWVRLRIFEIWLSNATADLDPVTIRFWEERVAAAQRRYLAACESLARIRRLALRTPQLFQINVAGQQINVARPTLDQD